MRPKVASVAKEKTGLSPRVSLFTTVPCNKIPGHPPVISSSFALIAAGSDKLIIPPSVAQSKSQYLTKR